MPLGGGEAAHVALSQFVPTAETRARIEAALGPLAAAAARRHLADESRNFRFARRAGRRRLHQPGERALLRHLQPHAPHRRRQVPPLPAERRRARREARPALGRRAAGGRGHPAPRGRASSPPATASTRASRPRSARCSRSAARPGRSRPAMPAAGPVQPDRAVRVELLLPDGHGGLQRVDRVAAGREGLLAMGRGDRHRHAGLADLEPSPAGGRCRTSVTGQRRARLGRDLLHQRQRHLLVGLVLEMAHRRPAAVLVAHHAHEQAQRAVGRSRALQRRPGRSAPA